MLASCLCSVNPKKPSDIIHRARFCIISLQEREAPRAGRTRASALTNLLGAFSLTGTNQPIATHLFQHWASRQTPPPQRALCSAAEQSRASRRARRLQLTRQMIDRQPAEELTLRSQVCIAKIPPGKTPKCNQQPSRAWRVQPHNRQWLTAR